MTVTRSMLIAVAFFLLGSALTLESWYERNCQRQLLRLEDDWKDATRKGEFRQDHYDLVVYAALFRERIPEALPPLQLTVADLGKSTYARGAHERR